MRRTGTRWAFLMPWMALPWVAPPADAVELLVGAAGGSSRLAPTSEYHSRPTHTMVRGEVLLLDTSPSPVLLWTGVSVGVPRSYVAPGGTPYRASASYADVGIGLRWPTGSRYFAHGGWGITVLLDYGIEPRSRDYELKRVGGVFQAGLGIEVKDGVTAHLCARARYLDSKWRRGDLIQEARFGNAEVVIGVGFWGIIHGRS